MGDGFGNAGMMGNGSDGSGGMDWGWSWDIEVQTRPGQGDGWNQACWVLWPLLRSCECGCDKDVLQTLIRTAASGTAKWTGIQQSTSIVLHPPWIMLLEWMCCTPQAMSMATCTTLTCTHTKLDVVRTHPDL